MAFEIGDDIQLSKIGRLLGALLEQGDTTTIGSVLTALGQIGYDTQIKRMKVYNGTSISTLLEKADIDTDSSFASPSNDTVPSTQAIVTYIANNLAGGTIIKGSVTMTSAGTFPVGDASTYVAGTQVGSGSGSGNTIKVGDAWYVGQAQAFQMGTNPERLVQKGDLIVALSNGAGNVDAEWLVLNADINDATTTTAGLVILSTLAKIQANGGADADKVITTALMNAFLSTPESGDANAHYSRTTKVNQELNSGSNVVTHNKNILDISGVTCKRVSDGRVIHMGWSVSTNNSISITRRGANAFFDIYIDYRA